MARTRKTAVPTSPQAKLAAVIKAARDTMRKDAGLNGDLDRIPQLAWLLFLRAFDGLEENREVTEHDYRPAIDEPYRFEGRKKYSKTKPIRFEEFADCQAWWSDRVENERAWRVPVADLEANDYNLDLRNPHRPDDLAHRAPAELVAELIDTEREILRLLQDLQAEIGTAS